MSRFTGFQNDRGVAVLDTLTGELLFYPFDGSEPTPLRPATTTAPPELEKGAMALPLAATSSDGRPGGARPAVETEFRPARRLEQPRPMVISYPDADEVALIKAARLARQAPGGDPTSRDED